MLAAEDRESCNQTFDFFRALDFHLALSTPLKTYFEMNIYHNIQKRSFISFIYCNVIDINISNKAISVQSRVLTNAPMMV